MAWGQPEYYVTGSGPIQGLCIRDFRLLWANSSLSVTSMHLIHGPIQLYFLAAVPLQAHARVSCSNLLRAGWANANSLPEYYGTGSGPMQGLCIRDFRLLWANSNLLVASVHLIHGPIRLYFPAALPLQAHVSILYGSPFCAGWANASSLPEYYGIGSGPIRGLCIRDFRLLWANLSSSVTSAHFIHGPIWLYFLVALLLQAHARVSCGSPLHSGWACCGPVQAHRQAAMHLVCRPMQAFCLTVDFLLAAEIMGQHNFMVEAL